MRSSRAPVASWDMRRFRIGTGDDRSGFLGYISTEPLKNTRKRDIL
jgi:hypothetical protein